MGELPTGTITLLFTDIEGSTALLSRLGDWYGEALSAQRALLRACFAEFRGHEMGTEGDSFFVVFQSAGDAVGCCLAAQRALSGHDWTGGIAVRVPMGLHSGESRSSTRTTTSGWTCTGLPGSRLLRMAARWCCSVTRHGRQGTDPPLIPCQARRIRSQAGGADECPR